MLPAQVARGHSGAQQAASRRRRQRPGDADRDGPPAQVRAQPARQSGQGEHAADVTGVGRRMAGVTHPAGEPRGRAGTGGLEGYREWAGILGSAVMFDSIIVMSC